jgi:putative ABC transport system permease protein
VTAGYFETLGVPLLEGRAPARTDADQGRLVMWVNNTFARQFLDNRAIGEWIRIQDTWLEIVGVVGDLRTSGLRDTARPMVYVPPSNPAVPLDVMHAVIRTTVTPASLATALRAAVDRVDRTVPLTTARTMKDIIAASLAQATFTVTLLAIAASVALILGVVGLYGVINYIVTQRTAEMGLRLALGAAPNRVRVMVLRQGLAVAVVGVIVGLGAAWASTRLMASVLFEVSARDPLIFATVALTLTAVSGLAIDLPARRAAGIDPLQALREEG